MDKKRLEYYKKKLATRREELVRGIARTEQEGREADEDPTVDLADKAANSYTKEFLFGQTHNDRSLLAAGGRRAGAHQGRHVRRVHFVPRRAAAEAARSCAVDALLHYLPGKEGKGAAVSRRWRIL